MLQTLSSPTITTLTLDGNAQAFTIPPCKKWYLKARAAANTLQVAATSGGAFYTIPAARELESPLGDYPAQTIYVKGTNADIAECLTLT
jgi:hypothetical protein